MKRDRQALSQFFEDWVDGEMTSTVANMFLGGSEDTYVVTCKLSPLSPVFSVEDIDRARESGAKWVAFIAPVAINNRLSNNGEYINSVDSAELSPGIFKLAFVVSVMRIGSSLGFNSYRYDDGVSPSGTIRRRLSVMNLYAKRKKSFDNLRDSYVAEALYDHEKQLTYLVQGIPEMFNSAYMFYGEPGYYRDSANYPLFEFVFGLHCNDVMPALHAMGEDSMWNFANMISECLGSILSRFGGVWERMRASYDYTDPKHFVNGVNMALKFMLSQRVGYPRVRVDMVGPNGSEGYFDTPVEVVSTPYWGFRGKAQRFLLNSGSFCNGRIIEYIGLRFLSTAPRESLATLDESLAPVWHQEVSSCTASPWFDMSNPTGLLPEPVLWWAKKLQELGTNR